MSIQAKFYYVDPHPQGEVVSFPGWWAFLRKISRSSRLKGLSQWSRKAGAVAQPAGLVYGRTHPTQGCVRSEAAITVISANLCHDWPRYRRLSQRLEDFARLVEEEKADVVLLQEVARTANFHMDEWLSKRLGMSYIYTRANGHAEIGFEEGLAVFSRFPLGNPYLRQLGGRSNPFVRRLALGAAVKTPYGDLLAFSVHLGLLPNQNYRQIAHLREWVDGIAGKDAALICGDFNAHETTRGIRRAKLGWLDTYRHVHPGSDGTTHLLKWPWGKVMLRHRLDYIFLRQARPEWQVLEARHRHAPGGPHSDHCAVVSRLSPL